MLLIHDGEAAPDAPVLRTGGVPLVPEGFVWPTCRNYAGALQFLAHLPVDGGAVAVFFCQNDPGMCDDWDAAAGGNRAYLFTGPLGPAAVPAEGETLLGAVTALRPQPSASPRRRPSSDGWVASRTGCRTTRRRPALPAPRPWRSWRNWRRGTTTPPPRTSVAVAWVTPSSAGPASGPRSSGSADRVPAATLGVLVCLSW